MFRADEDTIESKVAELRAELLKKAAEDRQAVNIYEIDEFGRPWYVSHS